MSSKSPTQYIISFIVILIFANPFTLFAETTWAADAASLDKLHDIEIPAKIAWWPPAPGWYVIAAGLLFLLTAYGLLTYFKWRANAYRREACQEWAQCVERIDQTDATNYVAEMSELLKRVALTVVPRQFIAHLSGLEWTEWLNAQGNGALLDDNSVLLLTDTVYRTEANSNINRDELMALSHQVRDWILLHQLDDSDFKHN